MMNEQSSFQSTSYVSAMNGDNISLPDCPSLGQISPDSLMDSDGAISEEALFGSGQDNSTQTVCTCTYRLRKQGEGRTIYVTLADDSEQHVEEVANFCKSLEDEGFKIDFDYVASLIKNGPMNINHWRDQHFTEANLVLVCVSPRYAEYCSPNSNTDTLIYERIPNENRLAVRYIFNHIRSEIKDEYCKNKRFIPIVFMNSGGSHLNIPRCLRIAWPFYFPYDEELLKDHILA
ncbi:hypothetical protein FSP39_021459 [Pinctada imbricata]|uniref:SEFIR domain-containing protein n=1 Tax=Pinctada imbricata TaxID=66713 RepID=A0AA88YF50_PINIB|nr:hypothetical protein FSP39_021459 [Pinctada imbricata]